jgi:hypothetical protein
MDAQVIPGTPTVSLGAARGIPGIDRGSGSAANLVARFHRAARSPMGTRVRAGLRAREHDGALAFALGRAASARRAADDMPAAVAVRDPAQSACGSSRCNVENFLLSRRKGRRDARDTFSATRI